MLITFIVLLVISKICMAYNLTQYAQNDYVVLSERFEVLSHDTKYVGNPKTYNFKYNRIHFALNFTLTLKADFNNDLRLEFQVYKFSSNEYRLFPVAFPINVCNVVNNNIFGLQNLYNCGKMAKCPMKKGYYEICNWVPDYTKFPPHFPRGRYMLHADWFFNAVEIMQGNWYFNVVDTKFLY